MSTAAAPRPSSRLWLPLLVLIAAPAVGTAIWFWPSDWDHGHRNLSVLALAMLSCLVLAFWLLFLSRFPSGVRIAPVALLVVGSGAFALCVREFHFTGDMWPVFTFRWDETSDDLLERDRARQQAVVQLLPPEERKVAQTTQGCPFESFFGFWRDGRVFNVLLSDDWSAIPPREVWRQRSGGGYAGFVVAEGRAVTIEQRRGDELVVAYDVDTGRELWQHRYAAHFKEAQGGDGPRATPTLIPFTQEDRRRADYKVYALGATGRLACFDLKIGEEVWSADTLKDNDNLRWGMAGSPLGLGKAVIVAPGAQSEAAKGRGLIAYDRESGKELWAAGNRRGAYSSPTAGTFGGRRHVLVFDGEGLTGYDAENGKELWHYPWVPMPPQGINVAQPLRLDNDRVFISSGYDLGCAMLQIKQVDGQWSAETLWQSKQMRCKFTSPVYRDGYVYGLDEGILTCVDAKDGKRRWKDGRYGHGQLLLVEGHLLILSERGDLAIVRATPDGYHELGRHHVLDGDKTWNAPALAGNYVFVRNHEWMACYELPAEAVGFDSASVPVE
jgi:outer membrane protein assembly factor BamB